MQKKVELAFGGSLLQGRRKTARPLTSKQPLHLVLKANFPMLLLRNGEKVKQTVNQIGQRFGVRVYEIGVHSDHVHLSLRVPGREIYRGWIRALTSALVRQIAGLKWKLRPFTRVCSWGRDFKAVKRYVQKNAAEGELILAVHLRVEKTQRI